MSSGIERIAAWFSRGGREPFAFQRETWDAYLRGMSGLVQAPTGMGKTLAAALGVVIEAIDVAPKAADTASAKDVAGASDQASDIAVVSKLKRRAVQARDESRPLTLLWITPLRALASDTVESLGAAMAGLGVNWSVELRTSDTKSSVRAKQKERLPSLLVTTPESMSLLLSYPDASDRFAFLECVVVDEWHELLGTKRGVQTELALARLRKLRPALRTWGLSATIANIDQAAATLVGPGAARNALIIKAPDDKPLVLKSVLPTKIERFPWAGHLGTRLLNDVINRIERAGTTLVFTNTRSQSELWFRALHEARPDWVGKIAVHHGSIDRDIRSSIEQMLRDGTLKAAVCTSSLDLGVDFWPVDQVIQIGSPKSVARAMQRAGRSGHRPGATSRILCVPTQAFELVEFSAARYAIDRRRVEPREPITMALDVLAQHVITIAAGGGFESEALRDEVRQTHAYSAITDQQWQWVMDFAERGGPSLKAYPRFARIKRDAENPNRWTVADDQLAKMHRMSIGTITADGAVAVEFLSGARLGSVEESFIAKLKPGDVFMFAGRQLQFVRVYQMVAKVRTAKKRTSFVPRWMGGRLPMSQSLADAVRLRLEQFDDGEADDPEMHNVAPILLIQRRWSAIPRREQILIENPTTREGHHHYIFPFQGRLVHEGLGALLAFRFGRRGFGPITATFNDYGVELLSPAPMPLTEADWREALSPERLIEDVLECVNSGELAKRQFREIARIAGLLVPTRPGAPRSVRQLQASSELFYDVFREFDPENLLLDQARREVLERQLEFSRLRSALERITTERLLLVAPPRITPLAFPLWAERIASQTLRFESASQRIERLAMQLENAAANETS